MIRVTTSNRTRTCRVCKEPIRPEEPHLEFKADWMGTHDKNPICGDCVIRFGEQIKRERGKKVQPDKD